MITFCSSGGAIAGIVIGSLIGLAILIGIVVACICGCNKNRGMSGRVVQPGGGMGMTVINTTSNQHGTRLWFCINSAFLCITMYIETNLLVKISKLPLCKIE